MVKSRSLAQRRIQIGPCAHQWRALSASRPLVKPGDRIELTLERRDVVLVVRLPGERRGPYEEARLLYDDLTPPPDEAKRLTPYEQAIRAPGSGRPTKKERRAIDRLMSDGGLENSVCGGGFCRSFILEIRR